ncbi:MAG: phosphatidate cytidylyltransferase [Bryobacterales bacterium]|nr:phosphatidate cytidylyltransferase [Bryobacterales bacterium]
MKRVLTALVLAPIIIYAIFWGPPIVFVGVTTLIACFCFYEFAGIAGAHGVRVFTPIGLVAGALVVTLPQVDLALLAVPALATLALALRGAQLAAVLPQAGALTLGLLYSVVPWRCAVALRGISPHWLMFALAINWIGDAAAFYAGSRWGKHKLAPRVSPGKSWEGALASVIGSAAFGVAYAHWFAPDRGWLELILLSVAANVAGQVGDLCESALKRGGGLKDSGTLLPGHGGWLDRVDSSLFSLPVVYIWLSRQIIL